MVSDFLGLRMLWAFDVLPILVDGKPVVLHPDNFTTGLVTAPDKLRYRLSIRSKKHEELIMQGAESAYASMASLDS